MTEDVGTGSEPREEAPHPQVTIELLAKGSSTLGHETNLARAPLWDARTRQLHPPLIAPSVLYGHHFGQVAGQPLTVADQRLLAELTTAYVREGCAAHRRVSFSLGATARLLGHETLGGEQRRLVRKSLARLRSVTVESALRHPDGNTTVLGWGLVDRYLTTTAGGGRGWVMLSDEIAELLRAGSVTYLHAPTWDAIAAEDEVAGRLWSFLETERIGQGWRYQLFSAPPGSAIDDERNLPAIGELLRLDWKRRRDIARRVEEACSVIAHHDPRYHLELVKGMVRGMWRLEVRRAARVTASIRQQAGLDATVLSAWRAAYKGRQPSARQVAVLREVMTRQSVEWTARTLWEESEGDALERLLDRDRQMSRQRLDAAIRYEAEWEATKRAENLGPQSFADLLRQAQRARGE